MLLGSLASTDETVHTVSVQHTFYCQQHAVLASYYSDSYDFGQLILGLASTSLADSAFAVRE
jgi:hypothetical protein